MCDETLHVLLCAIRNHPELFSHIQEHLADYLEDNDYYRQEEGLTQRAISLLGDSENNS